jgi:hypothetical protein
VPAGAFFYWGFALPFGPVARTALIVVAGRSLR